MSGAPVRLTGCRTASGRPYAAVRLNRSARANALGPELVDALAEAVEAVDESESRLLLLSAEGRHFSTGGDVAGFAEAHRTGEAEPFADGLVGRLQDIVLALRRLPAIVVTAAQGAITGGAAGLVFASDLVVLADNAFIQPYYREVGFAPDGGWCALLSDLIGARRALALQLANRRLSADDALALGLAEAVVPANRLDAAAAGLLDDLDRTAADALITAKRLVWDDRRLSALEQRLAAEKRAFVARIGLPETGSAMVRFLDRMKADHV